MAVIPPKLRVGDRVRLVSPASPPERASVLAQTAILEGWGLQVEFGDHIFDKKGYLAGEDDDRLADVNAAFQDPGIRAIFATQGGKGSYRIADRLDFDAVRRDPKSVVRNRNRASPLSPESSWSALSKPSELPEARLRPSLHQRYDDIAQMIAAFLDAEDQAGIEMLTTPEDVSAWGETEAMAAA